MNPDSVTARPATPQDDEFLRQLFFDVRAPEFEPAHLSPEELHTFLTQQYHAMRSYYAEVYPDAVYVILVHNGDNIGYEATIDRECLHVIDIALTPEARNFGIGTHRMERLKARASLAPKPLTLTVEKFNPARHLYDRLGFYMVEDLGVYQMMKWVPPEG